MTLSSGLRTQMALSGSVFVHGGMGVISQAGSASSVAHGGLPGECVFWWWRIFMPLLLPCGVLIFLHTS